MARPGFNGVRWLDLPFHEALVMGWLGKCEPGVYSLQSFREHIKSYGPKIYKYHHLNSQTGDEALKIFEQESGVRLAFKSLVERTQFLDSFDVDSRSVQFELNQDRLHWEIEFLKNKGIGTVVSLTEVHHHKEIMHTHFDAHHFAIDDLAAPEKHQAESLAEILSKAAQKNDRVAVHCLAGIGRTSTMIMAAHILMGEDRESVKQYLRTRNPYYTFGGVQSDFIERL